MTATVSGLSGAGSSVSCKDQLKGSLGPSVEILKGPFQIVRVPMMQEQFYLKQ